MIRRVNPVGKKRLARLSERMRPSAKSLVDEAVLETLKTDKEQCEKERADAYGVLNKDQAEYDKQLLALSGTFLALSLAFIKDVVPLQKAICLWELYLSFGLMSVCICAVLASFQYSIHCHFIVVKFWDTKEEFLSAEEGQQDAHHQKMTALRERSERHGKRVRIVNLTSGILFLLGIVILVVFVISNIRMESRVSASADQVQENRNMSSEQHLSNQQPPQPPPRPQPPPPSSPVPSPGSYPKPPK